jgi:hypothetical protein
MSAQAVAVELDELPVSDHPQPEERPAVAKAEAAPAASQQPLWRIFMEPAVLVRGR